MTKISQTIIMPYHRNKADLLYTTDLLCKIVPDDVEIIIIGNNNNSNELDVPLSSRFIYKKFSESMMYSRAVNAGVELASGEIITLCDQDIYGYKNWYTPLLNKLISGDKIGSVSSKLLNPTNNRIIDFGIEYSPRQVTHTLRGHRAENQLTMVDRKATSTTSATLMMRKSLYMDVSGMDIDMPYCCSDCDIGMKINELGYENWVIANSVAYHKGSSSSNNGKSTSFSHLRSDSQRFFWAKNFHRLQPTVVRDIATSLADIQSYYAFQDIYVFVNLSTLLEYKWYADNLSEQAGMKIADLYSYKAGQDHYSDIIQLYDHLPYTFMNIRAPIIYFVDYFPCLQNNQIWKLMRDTSQDVVMDMHGNLVLLDDIIDNKC